MFNNQNNIKQNSFYLKDKKTKKTKLWEKIVQTDWFS